MTNIAQHVISKCGGAHPVAELLGIKPLEVYRWTYPTSRGGRGGLVPARYQVRLLALARAIGIDLRPEDFFGLDALPPLGSAPSNDNVQPGKAGVAIANLAPGRRVANSNQTPESEASALPAGEGGAA